jgi:hypothetical protein
MLRRCAPRTRAPAPIPVRAWGFIMSQKREPENGNVIPAPSVNGVSNGDFTRAAPTATAVCDAGTAGQRDRRGRFAKGNKGGPGNPFGPRFAALRYAAYDVVTPENMRDIISALVLRALTGDVVAIKLVLAYALGKPDVGFDGDENENAS